MTPEQIEPIIKKEEQEREQEINKEKAAFYNAKYEGAEVPEWFVKLFDKALFYLAAMSDNLSSKGLQIWLKKTTQELNFGEVMKMSEIIASVPRFRLFENMTEALDKLYPVEMIMQDVREQKAVFDDKMNVKTNELKNYLHKRKFELQNKSGTVKSQKGKKNKLKATNGQMASV